MAYFNGGAGGYFWLGDYVPLVKTDRVYCDDCAEAAVPLPSPEEFAQAHPGRSPGGRHWGTGFKWAPCYGGDAVCGVCGKPV